MSEPAWAVVAGVAFVIGLALGPVIDRGARWSLGVRDPVPWRPRPILTGTLAGLAGAIVVLLVPVAALIPAWVALAWVGAAIARTDLARHRIPDVLNGLAAASGAVLLVLPGDWGSYGRAWLAAAAVTAVLLVLALIGPSGLGMGDVKLGPALGLYLGFLGWESVLLGVAAGFVLGAVAALGVLLMAAVRRHPLGDAARRALPFGPFLLLGTLVGLLA